VVLLAACLAVIAPATLHNYLVGQDAVLITSNMGMNFFIGNNQRATGYYVKPKGLDLTGDIYGTKIANVHAGRGLKPSQVSRFWLSKGLDFIRERPGTWLRLLAQKALFFWNAYEIPQVENLYFLKRFVPLLRWPLLGFSVLGPLALLGMILSLRHWRTSYFLLAFVLAVMGSSLIFFVISRLRLQACPALLVFAAHALMWMWQRIRERDWRPLAVTAIVLAALALFVNWPFSSLDRRTHLAQAFRFHAHHLRETGRPAEAAREYQRAVETDPYLADSYVDLATLRMDQGDPEAALELFQQALRVDPEVSGVHFNFGSVWASQGLWDRAIAEFRRETEVSPYSFQAYESLYRAMRKGQSVTPDSVTSPLSGIRRR
jgi:tetratricopeptide (TPR) repeat protein